MREIGKSTEIVIVIILIVLISACQSTESGQEIITPEIARTPSTTPSPTEQPHPSPEGAPTNTPIPNRPLDSEGPWLLLSSPDTPWTLYNLDGTGGTQIELPEEQLITNAWGEFTHTSHSGRYLSTIIAIPEDPQLWILKLPEGELILQLALVGEQARNEIKNFEQFDFNPAVTIFIPPVLSAIGDTAWSPDGRYLAFTGAVNGLSSDVYIFDTEDNQITHLTNGPNQARIMDWSPDSRTIVHYSAEWQLDYMELIESLWAVDVSGNARELLDLNEVMIDPNIADWVNNTTLVMFYLSFESNPNNLTIMNILTGETEIIEAPGFRHEIFYADSTNQVLINYGALMGPSRNIGVFSYDLDTKILSTFIEDSRLIGRIENTPYYVSTNGSLLTPSGDVIGTLPGDAFEFQLPVASPDGNWIIMYQENRENRTGRVTSSVMNSDGALIHEWEFACRSPIWLKDSSGFFCYVPENECTELQIRLITQENNWEPVLVNTLSGAGFRVIRP